MSRKKETMRVPSGFGRDTGKTFVLTEMPSARAEKWGLRMLVALKGSGYEVPESAMRLGIVGVAFMGLNTFLRADVDLAVLEPLLDQMMECVTMIRDPSVSDFETPLSSDDDIEEVSTRLWLRSEIIRLHTDFSLREAFLKWIVVTRDVVEQMTSKDSQTTETSQP
jgi:hypothetical protein